MSGRGPGDVCRACSPETSGGLPPAFPLAFMRNPRYDVTSPEPCVPGPASPLSPAPALDDCCVREHGRGQFPVYFPGFGRQRVQAEDYLSCISTFVKENPEHIEAIRILLDRPRTGERMPLPNCGRNLPQPGTASRSRISRSRTRCGYNKALVDIISMVKHAAREEEPLCTAEQRIHRVFDKMAYTTSLTPNNSSGWTKSVSI